MATQIVTIIRDDMDGTDGAETVEFGIDGMLFEIDLGDKNQRKLREALAPYIASARQVRGQAVKARRGTMKKATAGAPAKVEGRVVREWWRDEGNRAKFGLPSFNDRGKIPQVVYNAFESAAV